ncbi:type II secretion system GspH family protein [Mesobacillus maritimus]|uniref:competence type IV pilus minor pilin ComGD n=1 Tax=Mesobacillus maritimus TaxID=1643336 RepID=UPI00203C0F54|nr:competence type IV pilus minor pilin ComGD [Mesobacillus maritimus]MCM3669617.1 type II secretion system GspH family protein [Mesobacillus maritimus]
MMNNNNGFTLIETLIVLSAFLVISFSPVLIFKPSQQLLESQSFLAQLQSDLLYAQQYAISHQVEVSVHIAHESNYYYIRTKPTSPALIERTYPATIRIQPDTLRQLYFQYMPDGNINRFGSFVIEVGPKRYRLMLLLGKGRFYVIEA